MLEFNSGKKSLTYMPEFHIRALKANDLDL